MINRIIKKYKWWQLISLVVVLILLIGIVVNFSKAETTNINDIPTKAENEKKIVRISAALAIKKDANGELTETKLLNELTSFRGGNRTTVEEVSEENVLMVTFEETGRQYKVDLDTGILVGDTIEEPEEPGDQVVPGEIVIGENKQYEKME